MIRVGIHAPSKALFDQRMVDLIADETLPDYIAYINEDEQTAFKYQIWGSQVKPGWKSYVVWGAGFRFVESPGVYYDGFNRVYFGDPELLQFSMMIKNNGPTWVNTGVVVPLDWDEPGLLLPPNVII